VTGSPVPVSGQRGSHALSKSLRILSIQLAFQLFQRSGLNGMGVNHGGPDISTP
jgi:hypothetical protein